MKKKIIFVMESLRIGGAEKSLVTLLSQLDYSKYDVDLFLFYQKGEFIDLIPKEVNLLDVQADFKSFILNPKESLKELIKRRKFKLFVYKTIEVANLAFNKFILNKEYIGWNLIKKSTRTIENEYDVAIGFLEKKSIYFILDKVRAKKKIGWIHTDYKKIQFNYKVDNYYLSQLNEIIAVSDPCKNSLIEIFPDIKENVKVIPNIISETLVKKMASEKIKDFDRNNNEIVICTVGRLTPAKGYDLAIECCEELVKRGLKFKWIVIGDGSERDKLEKMIQEKGLKDIFILIGSKNNPYSYMEKCDIYVQPSKWEGFGITVSEAKVLKKPIVVSNIPEFHQQIEHMRTGYIYKDMDEMIKYIQILIHRGNVRRNLCENLTINKSNKDEVEKLYALL